MKIRLIRLTLLLCLSSGFAFAQTPPVRWVKWWKAEEAKNTTTPEKVLKLNLQSQGLKKIPQWVYRFKNLQALNLSRNDIKVIPRKLNRLPKLTHIILSHNGMSKYYEQVKRITDEELKEVRAATEKIMTSKWFLNATAKRQKSVSDSLRMVVFKKRMEVIEKLPKPKPKKVKFQKCKYIKTITLKENYFTKIPKTLHCLINLEKAVLDKNEIVEISNKITRLKKLQHLAMNYNKLTSIDKLKFEKLPSLKVLFLGRNQITAIPNDIAKLSNLEKLNLAANKIETINNSIEQLGKLRHLILYENKIKNVPDFVFDMRRLIELDLAYNQLTTISPKLGQLTQVEDLYLSYNQLTEIPNTIGNMESLKRVYLHHNKLYDVPKTIGKLKNVKVLHLNNNQMLSIPEGIFELKKMEDLNLAYNKLAEYSEKLADFPKLKLLFIGHNPLDKNSLGYRRIREMFDEMKRKNIIVND